MRRYHRAPIAPLRDTVYGIGIHWTTWTSPREGAPLPFPEAVERFDVPAFVGQVREAGAGHVMITATHKYHWLPGPNAEVDRILPGRTCKRDLLMELADALLAIGVPLMVYYNHGTLTDPAHAPGLVQDPEWQEAVGSRLPDRARYYDNYCRVLAWMGEHYREKIIAYWFDSAMEHMRYPDTPWERFAAASKAGFADRLISYNTGVFSQYSCTECEDYWAGELNGINFYPNFATTRVGAPPIPALTAAGLPYYAFCTWRAYDPYFQRAEWGIHQHNAAQSWPVIDPAAVAHFLKTFRTIGGAVTFNVLCSQDGSIIDADMQTLRGLKDIVRGEACCADLTDVRVR